MNILNQNDPDIHYFNWDVECAYFETRAFRESFSNNQSDLKIINVNIRSFNKNGDELLVLLQQLGVNFEVIILTETWLNEELAWLDIPGYVAYHSKRVNRGGGGVTVLVRSNLNTMNIVDLSVNIELKNEVNE